MATTTEPFHLPWLSAVHRTEWLISDERVQLTAAEFETRIHEVAEHLVQLGVGRGAVVAIMLPNQVDLVVAILAVWRTGAAATLVNPEFTFSETSYQVADSKASLLITSTENAWELDCSTIAIDALGRPVSKITRPASTGQDEIALVIYTSGSTGRPKGVLLSHGNLLAMAQIFADHLAIEANDHCLLFVPLFHVNAVVTSVLVPLLRGARITIMPRFSREPFLHLMRTVKPTYISGVPAVYAMLASLPENLTADLSSLRFGLCGSAPVSLEVLDKCRDRYGIDIIEGYGLTEGTCASTLNPLKGIRKPGTVGPAMSTIEVAIIRPDGSPAVTGERGEVLIKGPTVMQGYLGRPQATAEAITDGWLHTGDIGFLDEDGYLTIVDRIKDMIIRGGENLYPKEIERTIESIDGVLECAVVGKPDEVLGEVPAAWIVLYPDARVTENDVLAHCHKELTRVKVPAHVAFVDQLPRNPVGKADKIALRKAQ